MHFVTPILFLVFLLFRWLALRRQHSNNSGATPVLSVWVLVSRGPSPIFWRALREELIAWLVAGLGVLAIFLMLFLIAAVFGPIRPIHEWVR